MQRIVHCPHYVTSSQDGNARRHCIFRSGHLEPSASAHLRDRHWIHADVRRAGLSQFVEVLSAACLLPEVRTHCRAAFCYRPGRFARAVSTCSTCLATFDVDDAQKPKPSREIRDAVITRVERRTPRALRYVEGVCRALRDSAGDQQPRLPLRTQRAYLDQPEPLLYNLSLSAHSRIVRETDRSAPTAGRSAL